MTQNKSEIESSDTGHSQVEPKLHKSASGKSTSGKSTSHRSNSDDNQTDNTHQQKQLGPLAQIKVLDLTRILAGPWATQCLADYGATVWKVEQPGKGDDTRHWGPPFVESTNVKENSCSKSKSSIDAGYFLSANRNKQSIAIDIRTAEGQELVRQLAAKADVVIENFKVGGLKKYGLDYKSLKVIKPDLVYLSITGFGQTGPNAHKAGYDAMIQASAGLMSITGESNADKEGAPVKVGVAVADLMTGMYAVSAILAALVQKEQTGAGAYIDLALYDTQVAWLANQAMNYCLTKEVPQRMGSAHPNIAPYQAYQTSNGYFMLAVGNDRQFEQCCSAIGASFLNVDSRFSDNQQRVANRGALNSLLTSIFVGQPSEYWINLLEAVGVPCGEINNLQQVFESDQVKSRGLLQEVSNLSGQRIPMIANPVNFSEFTMSYQAPPQLGQHTNSILTSLLAKNEKEIDKLHQKNIIQS
jgi:crotonobetainyl-CoA:carnitine CoA-transferase CaiB-like acyl-CoA transferase